MSHILKKKDLETIYEKVIEILEQIGITFGTEKALELLGKNGAKIEGSKAFIPKTLLERCLESLPKYDYENQGPKRITATSPFGMVPTILDDETGTYRSGTVDDVVKMYQLTQTSDLYECASPCVIDPVDSDAEDLYVGQIAMLLRYSDKWPSVGIRATAQNSKDGNLYQSARKSIRLIREFYDVWDEPVMGQSICPMSPLAYDWECLDNLTAAIEEKQNIILCPCSLTGLTGPASLLGLVIHDIAISLAGIVYAQLLSPGIDVSICSCSGATDMRSIQPAYGTVECVYIEGMLYEFAKYMQIGCTICGALSDSAKVDYQAGAESMLTTLMPYYASEINEVWCYPGLMSAWYCGSFEKLILDEEMMRNVNRALKGVNLKLDPKLMRSLTEAQEKNTFLQGKTPSAYRKDHYLTKIFSKYGVSQDISPEKTDIRLKVKREIENRINEYQAPEITKEQKEILKPHLPSRCSF